MTGLKLRCWQGCFPFWWLWKRIAVLFSSLCGLLAFLVSGPLPSLKLVMTGQVHLTSHHSDTHSPPSLFHISGRCDYIGHTWMIQDLQLQFIHTAHCCGLFCCVNITQFTHSLVDGHLNSVQFWSSQIVLLRKFLSMSFGAFTLGCT